MVQEYMNILWMLRRKGRRDKDCAEVNEYTVDDQEGREGGTRIL